MDFNGNQTVQGPKDSFSSNCNFCTETLIWTLNRLDPIEVHYMEKILESFHQKP